MASVFTSPHHYSGPAADPENVLGSFVKDFRVLRLLDKDIEPAERGRLIDDLRDAVLDPDYARDVARSLGRALLLEEDDARLDSILSDFHEIPMYDREARSIFAAFAEARAEKSTSARDIIDDRFSADYGSSPAVIYNPGGNFQSARYFVLDANLQVAIDEGERDLLMEQMQDCITLIPQHDTYTLQAIQTRLLGGAQCPDERYAVDSLRIIGDVARNYRFLFDFTDPISGSNSILDLEQRVARANPISPVRAEAQRALGAMMWITSTDEQVVGQLHKTANGPDKGSGSLAIETLGALAAYSQGSRSALIELLGSRDSMQIATKALVSAGQPGMEALAIALSQSRKPGGQFVGKSRNILDVHGWHGVLDALSDPSVKCLSASLISVLDLHLKDSKNRLFSPKVRAKLEALLKEKEIMPDIREAESLGYLINREGYGDRALEAVKKLGDDAHIALLYALPGASGVRKHEIIDLLGAALKKDNFLMNVHDSLRSELRKKNDVMTKQLVVEAIANCHADNVPVQTIVEVREFALSLRKAAPIQLLSVVESVSKLYREAYPSVARDELQKVLVDFLKRPETRADAHDALLVEPDERLIYRLRAILSTSGFRGRFHRAAAQELLDEIEPKVAPTTVVPPFLMPDPDPDLEPDPAPVTPTGPEIKLEDRDDLAEALKLLKDPAMKDIVRRALIDKGTDLFDVDTGFFAALIEPLQVFGHVQHKIDVLEIIGEISKADSENKHVFRRAHPHVASELDRIRAATYMKNVKEMSGFALGINPNPREPLYSDDAGII